MATLNDITVIPLEGDLDVTCAAQLRVAVDQLKRAGCRRVIVNMANSEYIDTAGMGALVASSRRFREAGGLLSISNASPQVMHALRVGCLIDFIPARPAADAVLVPELDPSVPPLWQRTIRVTDGDIATARRRFTELVDTVSLTPDEAFDLSLACGEAIGNAVDHTSQEGVLVTVSAYADRVVVRVTDNGEGFAIARDETPEETEERGRGIRLMRMLVDSVDIRCKTAGHGTAVTIVKMLDAS